MIGRLGRPSVAPPLYDDRVLLLAAVLGIGLMMGWGLGGALRNVATVEIRLWPALPGALALQALPVPSLPGEVGRNLPFAVLVLSYLVLLAVLAVNVRLRGFLIVLLGVLLNLAPILANRGMPVLGEAVERAGGSVEAVPRQRGQKHHLATEQDRLVPLADVIAVREPFGTVVSVGDLLMYAGAAVFLAAAMLGRSRREPPLAPAPGFGRSSRPSTTWGNRR
jgi:Family of unknown function (DUF5317)